MVQPVSSCGVEDAVAFGSIVFRMGCVFGGGLLFRRNGLLNHINQPGNAPKDDTKNAYPLLMKQVVNPGHIACLGATVQLKQGEKVVSQAQTASPPAPPPAPVCSVRRSLRYGSIASALCPCPSLPPLPLYLPPSVCPHHCLCPCLRSNRCGQHLRV